MKNIPITWKTLKGNWNSSLIKKIKSLGKMKLGSCLKLQEVVEQNGQYAAQ